MHTSRIVFLLVSFTMLCCISSPLHAAPKKKGKSITAGKSDDRGLAVVEKNRANGKRVALVIGNSSYRHTDSMPKLSNPANDADDMAAALRKFGFDVTAKKNLTKEEMDETITAFGRAIADSDAALFYYAGHGLQVKGQNYLVPVDANIDSEAKVPYRAVNVNQLLEEMDSSKSRVNIVMLDACRNNPISGKFRSGASRGLAPPSAMPKGTVIVYATDPGNVAADGNGRNGVFTSGLLTSFRGNDLTLGGVLYAASKQVQDATGQQQTPYINGSATLQREFSFDSQSTMIDFKLVQPQNIALAPQPAPQRRHTDTGGIEMVTVPGGCFQMGFSDGVNDEKLVHDVCVNGFSIGKYEVTQRQWQNIMGSKLPNFKRSGDDFPVVGVSWNDAQEFIRKLNQQTGGSYRLPTEAEWEYAARSGGKNEQYSGGNNLDAVAWHEGNSDVTLHSVGTKQANGLGIHDMSGNVSEWCQDWYEYSYYKSSPRHNPQGPSSGQNRTVRGGGYYYAPAWAMRTTIRGGVSPDGSDNILGFRLASSPAVQ